MISENSTLDTARREYEARRYETQKLWAQFKEQKTKVEADGAKAAAVADLETQHYRPYERSAAALKNAEERYRSLLEQQAEVESTVTPGEATDFLRNVKASALGDHSAHNRLLGEQKGSRAPTPRAATSSTRRCCPAICRHCGRARRSASVARISTSARTKSG